MIDISDFEETFTVSDVLKEAKKALNSETANVPVYLDEGCGHPVFFTGEVEEAEGKFAKFSFETDEEITPDNFVPLEKFIALMESIDGELVCIVQFENGDTLPFYFGEVSEYIDSGEIYYRQEDGENVLGGHTNFARFSMSGW